jgi:cytochrome c-type biogenesis protein CcmH/NrfG
MPFNWGLLLLVIAVAVCVLGLAFTGVYLLNKSVDQSGR